MLHLTTRHPEVIGQLRDACLSLALGWRRGVVVSGVRRMNEVNARRARLVLGWVTVFISKCDLPSYCLNCTKSGKLLSKGSGGRTGGRGKGEGIGRVA